jgi:hypothetical protein
MSRSLLQVLPWAALALVTVFALAQVRARRGGPPAPVGSLRMFDEHGRPGSAAPRAAEILDHAFEDRAAMAASRDRAWRERDEALLAFDRAEAARAVLAARLAAEQSAREAPVPDAAADPAEATEIEGLRAELAVAREEARRARESSGQADLLAWLEDAASEDHARRARARRRAAEAKPEDVEALRRALAEDPARAPGVGRLVGALPPGEAAGALAVALLLGPGAGDDPARRVAEIGPATLLRVEVFERVLAEAVPAVRQEVLSWVAAREKGWSEIERTRIARALGPLLGAEDPGALAAAVRGVGILRLPGLAARLAALLDHDRPDVRAAAAHALSRVERDAEANVRARAALPRLLVDDDLPVRIAGRLLAEAVLGRPVVFDPEAPPEARQRALDALGPLRGE